MHNEKECGEPGFHVHADGTAHSHGPAHAYETGPGHTHPHVHANKKAVHDRLAKARGHLDSVIRMIDNDRDCSEVLVQLAAVRSAINNAGKVLLQDHITECITEAIRDDDRQKIADLNKAIEQFMK
jgi:DNA-binding FrmR family transcriptional regulator